MRNKIQARPAAFDVMADPYQVLVYLTLDEAGGVTHEWGLDPQAARELAAALQNAADKAQSEED